MFAQGSFITPQGMTPDQLARKRAMIEAMMPQFGKAQYIGEGLGQLLTGIGMGRNQSRLDKTEAEQTQAAQDRAASIFGRLQGNAPQGAFSVLGMPPMDDAQQIGFDTRVALGKETPATADAIRAGLVQRGLPEHVADGFVMNMQDESGLNPAINEISPLVEGSRGGFGLYQLTGPRRVAYEKFAQERGVPANSVNAQLDFLVSELQGPESAAARNILSTRNAGEAGAAIVNDFLRPLPEHAQRRAAQYMGGAANPQAAAQALPTDQLMAIMMDPWQPAEVKAQAQAMLAQQQKMADPAYQMGLQADKLGIQKTQLELAQMQEPKAPTPTDDMREYEFARSQGFDGSFQDYMTANKAAGAPKTDITLNGENNGGAFIKKADEAAAARFDGYMQAGNNAQRMMADIKSLSDLAPNIGTGKGAQITAALGPYAQALGVEINGLDDAQAFQSIVDRMAPAMRPAGSGASSDFDAKQFLSSLPQLGRTPEGNQIIINTLSALQQHQIAAAEIAAKATLPADQGGMSWQEAEKQIRALGDPYELFKKTNGGKAPAQAGAQPSAVAPPASAPAKVRTWNPATGALE